MRACFLHVVEAGRIGLSLSVLTVFVKYNAHAHLNSLKSINSRK